MNILIADDHPLLRNGLSRLLQDALDSVCIKEAKDGTEVFAVLKNHPIDILILDINMPVMDGFQVMQKLAESLNPPITIFLTMYRDEQVFHRAMDLGVKGYLLKEDAVTDIIRCIETVKTGRYYISSSLSDLLIRRNSNSEKNALEDLTHTESVVLKLLSEMKTSKQIADELNISSKTVTNHRANICTKLNLQGSHALLKFALENKRKF